jgi:hypothetical protein
MFRMYSDTRDYLGVERRKFFTEDGEEAVLFESREKAVGIFPDVADEKELNEKWDIHIEEVPDGP